ncbi:MAG: TIGR03905 family TSCPD domain-containing protein [Bacilli bacterium]|nr:TIGR03905 family TSCPD domain-containing protein [Bacilli bacterium]
MHKTYKTSGTCSTEINFDVEDNKIYNLKFTGGCNGNIKGIASLVEGQDINTVKDKLKGIKCGFRNTSCPDQLAKALEEIKS